MLHIGASGFDLVASCSGGTAESGIREKLEPFVSDFCQDEAFTRHDSNQRMVEVVNPRTGEMVPVHQRIWRQINKEQQYSLFIGSKHYARFRQENSGATVGYTTWSIALKKVATFVCDPRPESCVDEKISGLEQSMAALHQVLGWDCVKAELEGVEIDEDGRQLSGEQFADILRKAGSHRMIEAVCCDKEEQPPPAHGQVEGLPQDDPAEVHPRHWRK